MRRLVRRGREQTAGVEGLERIQPLIERYCNEWHSGTLNAKYLGKLWRTLSTTPATPDSESPLLDQPRRQWQSATPGDVEKLVAWVGHRQQALFQYNPIGHIGKDGTSKVWLDSATPLTDHREFSVALPDRMNGDASIFLPWSRSCCATSFARFAGFRADHKRGKSATMLQGSVRYKRTWQRHLPRRLVRGPCGLRSVQPGTTRTVSGDRRRPRGASFVPNRSRT